MIKEMSIWMVVAVNLYFLLKKRRIDFLTIYCFSSLIYYLPLFWGKAILTISKESFKQYALSEYFYFVILLNFIFLLFWAYIFDNYLKKSQKIYEISIYNSNKKTLKIIFIFIFMLLLITIKENYSIIFSSIYVRKSELLEKSSRFSTFFKQGLVYTTLYYFISRKYDKNKIYDFLIILLNLFTVVFLAHRSYTVIAIISCIYFKQYTKKRILFKKIGMILSGIMLFVIVSISKKIITPIKLGMYDLVIQRLTDFDYILSSIIKGEQSVTSTILNQILVTDFRVHYESYLGIFSNFFIYGDKFFSIKSFSSMFQQQLFPFIDYGMGSSFLGEAYSNGGIIFLIIIINLLLILLVYISKLVLRSKKINEKTFFIIVGIYFSFYVHRNSMGQTITFLKRYLFIYMLIYLFNKIKWRIRK